MPMRRIQTKKGRDRSASKRPRSSRVKDIAGKISSATAESSRDYLQLYHFNDLHGGVGGDGRRIEAPDGSGEGMPPLHALALGAWFARHGPVQHGIRIVPPLDGPGHTEPRIGHRPVRL